ncbi:hypothetical protein [Sphingobium bisphenolivorans]|uniref:hypothetical protein n=1 Tax=Sphingobium bisphenolivorans TaxID=1335760 RepID=UPI00039DE870|nr:hypothetical protein [Sphingobium bisphenolivorans]
MRARLQALVEALMESGAEKRRREIAAAVRAAGVEDVGIEGELVRLRGPGLRRRWLSDLALREAGRGRG